MNDFWAAKAGSKITERKRKKENNHQVLSRLLQKDTELRIQLVRSLTSIPLMTREIKAIDTVPLTLRKRRKSQILD